jgi:glycosyltransferase involved in cell wall biosynthesis
MKTPRCTVLMPVFNGEKYLKEAIESILTQTWQDFEFLIINDGSTDSSDRIITSYSDQRITYRKHEQNLGFSQTLNEGIKVAQGDYIARMDCDDVSLPERLAVQIEFLETHPDYGVVGTLFSVLNESREITQIGGVKLLEDEELRLGLYVSNIFCHGETMYRRQLCLKHHIFYNQAYTPCEDYDLWIQLSKVTKFKTIPQVLYYYMFHTQGMTGSGRQMQARVEEIRRKLKESTGFPPVTIKMIATIFRHSRNYSDRKIKVNMRSFRGYLRLGLQVFLFRLGTLYLANERLDGIGLFLLSFVIDPLNYVRHVLHAFPKDVA